MLYYLFRFTIIGITNIIDEGIYNFWNENHIYIVLFFIAFTMTIYLLTATFFPIIKINKIGISAYSIFWKRNIKWEEIQSVNLLKMKVRGGSSGPLCASFELTRQPEKKSALSNRGERVATFIIIRKSTKSLKKFLVRYQLLTHSKITKLDEIAFEFEPEAWQIIADNIIKNKGLL